MKTYKAVCHILRFQTIMLNKLRLNSLMFQYRKSVLKTKMTLQLLPSCYRQNTRIQLFSLGWMTSILSYKTRNMEKTARQENWDEESSTKMMTCCLTYFSPNFHWKKRGKVFRDKKKNLTMLLSEDRSCVATMHQRARQQGPAVTTSSALPN